MTALHYQVVRTLAFEYVDRLSEIAKSFTTAAGNIWFERLEHTIS